MYRKNKRKNICFTVLLMGLILILTSCVDKKIYDNRVNVIFFTANEGATLVESILDANPGDLVERPEDPTREGYSFTGWYKDKELLTLWDFSVDTIPSKSVLIYAGWSSSTYTITYDLNEGSFKEGDISETTFTPSKAVVFKLPIRTGYKFDGWRLYDQKVTPTKPGESSLISTKGISSDLVIYAHWKIIETLVRFYNYIPGTETSTTAPSSVTLAYGTVIDFPILEDTEEYRFKGWNSLRNGSGTFYINGDIFTNTNTLSVHAIWEKK